MVMRALGLNRDKVAVVLNGEVVFVPDVKTASKEA